MFTLSFVSFLSRPKGLKPDDRPKNVFKPEGHWVRLSGDKASGPKTKEKAEPSSTESDWSRASVAIPSYRRGEKRRSSRVTLAVPVRVDGENIEGEKFIVSTVTIALSQFGCLLQLDENVLVDQTLILMNEHTRQSVQARVVSTRKQRNGHKYVGAEFVSPAENFWRMTFVKPGARSLKKIYGNPDA